MKKALFLLACSIALWSCTGGSQDDTSGDASSSSGEYEDASESDANAIIAYNNAFVDKDDAWRRYLEHVGSNLAKIEAGLAEPDDPVAFVGLMTPLYAERPNMGGVSLENPPSALNEEDREFFDSQYSTLNVTFDSIRTEYDDLTTYLDAEDYKDDQGVRGQEMIQGIAGRMETFFEADSTFQERLSVVANAAERTILKDHPLKDYIFALKDDAAAVGEFVELAAANGGEYSAHESAFQAAYEKIEALNQEHAGMSPPDEEEFPGKAGSFQRFNEQVTDFLTEARRIMRDASASGAITESDFDTLVNSQDRVRSNYNSFMD